MEGIDMGRSNYYYGGWAQYVPVAERRKNAARSAEALKKKGRACQPVAIEGRGIARTFWGKKWCDNLEAYSDYANRLPRGRTYVRNGSVIDLQLAAGKINALVSGSAIYEVVINVRSLDKGNWQRILKECAGKVASLVELLQGRLSSAVMDVVTRRDGGLFPGPKQIDFRCSCPDSAYMCKHVAATLYGIGVRLDAQPELLFLMRGVDPQELIRHTATLMTAEAPSVQGGERRLENADLSGLFGIELDEAPTGAAEAKTPKTTGNANKAKATPSGKRTVAASAAPKPKRAKTVAASTLIARGIPRHMIQVWLNSDVLLRTEMRGVYQVTAQTERRIKKYLESRAA